MILQKTRYCLWKLNLGILTYDLINLLGLSGPNVVSRHRPKFNEFLWNFMIILDSSCNSGENEALFVKIRARDLELWLDTSFGPSGPNVVSKPETLRSMNFLDFIILLESSYDSGENEVLFAKIWARNLDLWHDNPFGPKWPKSSF